MSTLTIQPGTIGSRISQLNPTQNYGSSEDIIVRVSFSGFLMRGVFKFDFSTLPDGVTISSAIFSLNSYDRAGDDPVGRTFWTYRVTTIGLIENEVTWNSYKTGSNWTTPGGDYTVTDGSSVILPASLGWIGWNMTALAQYFQANTSKIAYLLVRDGDETSVGTSIGYYFHSKEYTGDTSLRPKLVITYTAGVVDCPFIQCTDPYSQKLEMVRY